MKRQLVKERKNWRHKFDEIGFTFHSMGDGYWTEGVCYQFSSSEIDLIEQVTADLHELCLEAVEYATNRNLYAQLGIPPQFAELINRSWRRQEPSLYGRFDFLFSPDGELKLLEYNADTPTSLIESSVAQWLWLEELFPQYDQFNSIHEKLPAAFTLLKEAMPAGAPFYFTCMKDSEEDLMTVEYLRDVALQAGLEARHIYVEDIGFNDLDGFFYDLEEERIEFMFKLYPWEWMLADKFGEKLLLDTISLVEPPWKIILSSKGLLPLLWQMSPGHPHLLAAYFDPHKLNGSYAKKPIFSREGANVTLYRNARPIFETSGEYGEAGFVYQELHEIPDFDGHYPVIGSWIIDGVPAGVGIREDDTPITTDKSRFVPHYFEP
ncbi:MAG: glutathionylspermidine synthase family protein [Deltaproteobacteria bacterium]|nr:glutathionylspermidine synthase family protein [Deltaproteobacteria bacterium]